MIKSWDNICDFYEELACRNNKFKNMLNLVVSVRASKYLGYIYGYISMYDLYIVQSEVEYPYDGPRLIISPLLEDDKMEFRYIDTYSSDKQWKSLVNGDEGFKELESYFFNIHWFYPNFTSE